MWTHIMIKPTVFLLQMKWVKKYLTIYIQSAFLNWIKLNASRHNLRHYHEHAFAFLPGLPDFFSVQIYQNGENIPKDHKLH
jgi:hypothetical protein